jgi:hypothetical protein
MANTFELIASSTVGVLGAASIDFTSIPSTYTDLCLNVSVRGSFVALNDSLYVNVNGSTANQTGRVLLGDGSTAGSQSFSRIVGRDIPGVAATSNTFSNISIYCPNYAGSSFKSFSIDDVMENNGTTVVMGISANLWSITSAITSLSLVPASGNFVQYSTAYLYGVKNA